jgi:hypothetical protein
VQEVVKASHLAIRCGPYEVGIQSLEMIQELQDSNNLLSQYFFESSVPMQLFKQHRRFQEQAIPGEAALVNLLYITRSSIATDPRDKIFALYSLLTDSNGRGAIIIDYGIEIKKLYQDVTQSLVSRGRSEAAFLVSIIPHALVDDVQRPLYHPPP